jgi:hypothetical protein
MASVRKTLTSLFAILRSQSEAQRDLSVQIQAICDYLAERDPAFAQKFSKYESENLADPSLATASALSLKLIDGVIQSLKDGEPLEL